MSASEAETETARPGPRDHGPGHRAAGDDPRAPACLLPQRPDTPPMGVRRAPTSPRAPTPSARWRETPISVSRRAPLRAPPTKTGCPAVVAGGPPQPEHLRAGAATTCATACWPVWRPSPSSPAASPSATRPGPTVPRTSRPPPPATRRRRGRVRRAAARGNDSRAALSGNGSPFGGGFSGNSGDRGTGNTGSGNSDRRARRARATPAPYAAKVDPGLVESTQRWRLPQEQAAGTGIVLSSNGVVLTNNHVINGAPPTISVTDVGNQKTYPPAWWATTAPVTSPCCSSTAPRA